MLPRSDRPCDAAALETSERFVGARYERGASLKHLRLGNSRIEGPRVLTVMIPGSICLPSINPATTHAPGSVSSEAAPDASV
jgi:hypothetical protein